MPPDPRIDEFALKLGAGFTGVPGPSTLETLLATGGPSITLLSPTGLWCSWCMIFRTMMSFSSSATLTRNADQSLMSASTFAHASLYFFSAL